MLLKSVLTLLPIARLIVALDAFATGSRTNTEVLLGWLQTEAASTIGASQLWLAEANSTSADIGKILSPQCIATAAAVGFTGQDGKLLGTVLKWALLMLARLIVGLLCSAFPETTCQQFPNHIYELFTIKA